MNSNPLDGSLAGPSNSNQVDAEGLDKKRKAETKTKTISQISKDAVVGCLGNSQDFVKYPCNEELKRQIYETGEVSWNFWKKVKNHLLRSLYSELAKNYGDNYEFPGHKHMQVRMKLIYSCFV